MIIIVSPSLDVRNNISGISSVTRYIVENNKEYAYIHFQQGKQDNESRIIWRLIRLLSVYKEWKQLLTANPKALIHYNYPLDALSIVRDFFFIRYAYKHKRSMVIHLHGGLYLFKDDKPKVIDYMLRNVFSYDVPLIVLSNKEKEHICESYHRQKVFSLPNCIDLANANNFVREKNMDKLRLLYLGRIDKNKGIDYILEALKVLDDQKVDFLFRMAGKENVVGKYICEFKKALGNKFKYCGVVSGRDKDELLKKSDVFIMPSFYEGLPMSLLECMSFGVVPVVTDVGSIGEYVKENGNGKIVKVKNVDTIVEAIKALDKNRTLLLKLSKNAQNTMLTRLTPEGYMVKLNEIYKSIS